MFVQFFTAWIYSGLFDKDSVEEVINWYDKLISRNHSKEVLSAILDPFDSQLIHYSLLTFLFSILIAFSLSRIVRSLGLDRKYKMLRYSNQWYYLFSGEILHLRKFKQQKILSRKLKKQFLFAHIDALVKEEGKTKLYSGVLTDYDLSPEKTNNIDRLYLTDARRFKKGVDNEVVSKLIPGHLFVILGDQLLNINVTYVHSTESAFIQKLKFIRTLVYLKAFVFILSIPFFYYEVEDVNYLYYQSYFS